MCLPRLGGSICALVLALLLTGCGGDDPGDSAGTPAAGSEQSSTPDVPDVPPQSAPPATEVAGGNCTATGTVTGDFEAEFTDAPAYSSFIGEEGAYGVTVAADVSLDVFVLATGEITGTLTGPGVIFSNRDAPGMDVARDGSGGPIDADFEAPALTPGTARVKAEISCS